MTRPVALALAMLVAVCGCKGPLPPASPAPPAPTATGYGDFPPQTEASHVAGGAAQRFLVDMDVPGKWWTLFHSAELNAMIDEAVARNPDVAAAQASLRSARELTAAQRSSAYPNVQGSYTYTRQQTPAYYGPPLATSDSDVYSVHTLSLDVAYTPDVFGNLSAQTRAASATADAQRFEVEATYLTLTSTLVVTTIQIASLREQIDVSRRLVATNRRLLALTESQQSYAQASGLDVLAQESALRSAEQTIPPLEHQLAQARDQLARLLGRSPGDAPKLDFDLTALHLPEELPLSLPSKLVQQRPDIAAASADLAAASAQVDVAYTNRLPNFSITGQTATQALSLGGLFGPGTLLTMLTGQVAETFYDHGTLKHRGAAAIAAYDQAAAQYAGAVLSGLQNVADALAALHSDADSLQAAAQADRASARTLEITRVQRDVGQSTELAVATAEQADLQGQLALIQAQANRYMDTAALFAALGGGWWNREETR